MSEASGSVEAGGEVPNAPGNHGHSFATEAAGLLRLMVEVRDAQPPAGGNHAVPGNSGGLRFIGQDECRLAGSDADGLGECAVGGHAAGGNRAHKIEYLGLDAGVGPRRWQGRSARDSGRSDLKNYATLTTDSFPLF